MTARALLWCGHVRPPREDRRGNAITGAYDFPASKNDVAIAIRAARALGIRDREIYPFLCDDGLLPADFAEPVHDATAAALRRVVRGLAVSARPGDPLLFVASNHGERQGLLMTVRYDELEDDEPVHLTPGILDECLSQLDGPQVVLVATCHSGVFLPLGARPNRLVVTACDEEERYLVTSDDEDAHSPMLRTLLGAWCGVAPGDEAAPPRVSLEDAFEAARLRERTRNDVPAPRRTEPLRSGNVAWPP